MAMTLKQLKDANAADDAEESTPTQEVEEVETEAAAEETEEETDQAGESDPNETEEEPVESWMQTEGQTSEAGSKKPSFAGLKNKLRAKAAKDLGVKDDEINALRQENERLKSGQAAQPQAKPELAPRPTREQYDFDDDRYDAAVDEWNDAKFDQKLSAHSVKQQSTQSVEAKKRDIDSAVDQHYEKAAALVESGLVSETDYHNADLMVRGALDQQFPGNGDSIADMMISRLTRSGDGGEKVWFSLRDDSKRQTLIGKMRDDPSGLDAMVYLGQLQTEITSSPTKRVSRAPKPGSTVQGDASLSGSSSALHKKYKKAGDDVQARITLKRQAKAAGVDTSEW